MANKLTQLQYRTLSIIAECRGGVTLLCPEILQDRHHQALVKRGLLRLGADPFRTRANMLRCRITARGRAAVHAASDTLRAQAKVAEERDLARYAARCERGEA